MEDLSGKLRFNSDAVRVLNTRHIKDFKAA